MKLMNKHNKIKTLFSTTFSCKDFYKREQGEGFSCEHQKNCNVNEKNETMWTPVFGDENTDIMIVAKSPSIKKGFGPFSGGTSKHWLDENEKEVKALYDFIRTIDDKKPYFTDLVKCGRKHGKISKKMINNCINKFLINEIAIMEPRTIICVSADAHNEIIKLQKNGKIDCKIIVHNLLHYSKQANLQLSPDDKQKIIWPLQYKKKMADLKKIEKIQEWLGK